LHPLDSSDSVWRSDLQHRSHLGEYYRTVEVRIPNLSARSLEVSR
jgi:hypothetical protein